MRLIPSLLLNVSLILGIVGSSACSNPDLQTATVGKSDLQQMVLSKLSSDPRLARVDVTTDSSQNQVTLSGTVQAEEARTDAVNRTKSVRDHLVVVDKIDVEPQVPRREEYTQEMAENAQKKAKLLGDRLSQSLDDTWIYTKIEAKLASRSANTALKIHVDVFQSEVTLRGEVDSLAAKDEAERIVKTTEGVKQVNDLLIVKV
jgi:osmotically-inducible protein OsmY